MNVGIIGLGSIAYRHIAALISIDCNVRISALRHSANSEAILGVQNVYSMDELLSQELDFIIISNPTALHWTTLNSVARSKLPLFIEKPLFDTLVPMPKIDSLTYVACNLRFLECLQWVKSNICNQQINEVNAYCGSYLPAWRKGVDWRAVYSANKEMGGGVHIDLIHELDYLYWIFGQPQSVTRVVTSSSSLAISAIDYANYCLIYDTFAASVILNYYRRDYKRTLEIVLDNQTWSVDLAANSVSSNQGLLFKSDNSPVDTYAAQMRYFVDLVRHGQQTSFNSIDEAYNVLQICLKDDTSK